MIRLTILFLGLVSIFGSSCKKGQTCDLRENDQAKIENIYGVWKVAIDEEVWRIDTLYRKSGGEYFSIELLEDGTGRQISNSIDTFRPFTWVFQFEPDKIAIDFIGNLAIGDLLFEIEENNHEHQKWIETRFSSYPFGPNAEDWKDVVQITRWKLKR